jgi:hypothetical protein
MSKIKDMVIEVMENLECGTPTDEIAYILTCEYEIPYMKEALKIVEDVRCTMNLANDCLEEVAQRF